MKEQLQLRPSKRGSYKVQMTREFKGPEGTTWEFETVFDPTDTSIQDEVDMRIIKNARPENKAVFEELIHQARGERPFKPIPEIGEGEEEKPM